LFTTGRVVQERRNSHMFLGHPMHYQCDTTNTGSTKLFLVRARLLLLWWT